MRNPHETTADVQIDAAGQEYNQRDDFVHLDAAITDDSDILLIQHTVPGSNQVSQRAPYISMKRPTLSQTSSDSWPESADDAQSRPKYFNLFSLIVSDTWILNNSRFQH